MCFHLAKYSVKLLYLHFFWSVLLSRDSQEILFIREETEHSIKKLLWDLSYLIAILGNFRT